MGNQNLKKYYDRYYVQVSDAVAGVPIPITRTPGTRHEAAVKFLFRYFQGGDIIEFGPGNGNLAKTLLASDLPITSYTLCEITPAGVEGLRRNLTDTRVNILEMDAEDIPDSLTAKYDAVLMIALIEHLIDPPAYHAKNQSAA